MCGIAGIVAPEVERHRDALQRMTDALTHRGPDGEGSHFFRNCALGHRRLAIIDIESGAQPMRSQDGRVAVTFNGEIYGYQELRSRLSAYPFRTHSDTEVILALYAHYGDQALAHLPGMFAFAIWDEAKQELFCARDRFGEKPFYYAIGREGQFIFASEIKSIIASGLIEPVLDPLAVTRYLRKQYVRSNQSIYSNIYALGPAQKLSYKDGKIHVSDYWSIPAAENDISLDEAKEQFDSLLHTAIRKQLIADVPVGAFLSGGLDSSTICAVAKELAGDLNTFSFDFEGDHSEVPFARAVASAYDTKHTELASPDIGIAEQLLTIQKVYDEPFGDAANIPTYLLSGEARKHVKVVLTGDAGDELFGGYRWYTPLLWMQRLGRVGTMRWIAERVRNRLYTHAGLPGAAARELRIMGMAYGRQYPSVLGAHHGQLTLFTQDDLIELGLVNSQTTGPVEGTDKIGTMDDVLRYDVEDYMPANNLTKIDRASMAHGLELRAPFLDVEFATFCLSLPYRLKVSLNEDKIILRRAFSGRWPEMIRNRSKQGFGAPVMRWLQAPTVRELDRRFLQDANSPIFEMLSYSGTRNVLQCCKPMQHWTLLVLAVWYAGVRGGYA